MEGVDDDTLNDQSEKCLWFHMINLQGPMLHVFVISPSHKPDTVQGNISTEL